MDVDWICRCNIVINCARTQVYFIIGPLPYTTINCCTYILIMDSSQETGVRTQDAEPRRSDRLTKGDTDAYALPAPLQAKERKAAEKAAAKAAAKTAEKAAAKVAEKAAAKAAEKTTTFSASTPQKTTTVTEEEAQFDLDIDLMEKSIQDEEQKLKDMVDQKRVQAKKTKLERLKLGQSQRIVKDAKEGEKKTEILISDLRKDTKLKKKAHKTLADLGLVSDSDQSVSDTSSSSQSDSSDFLKFVEPLKTHLKHKTKKQSSSSSSSSDSSDDSDSSTKRKSHKNKKKSKKSGMSKKAGHIQFYSLNLFLKIYNSKIFLLKCLLQES